MTVLRGVKVVCRLCKRQLLYLVAAYRLNNFVRLSTRVLLNLVTRSMPPPEVSNLAISNLESGSVVYFAGRLLTGKVNVRGS